MPCGLLQTAQSLGAQSGWSPRRRRPATAEPNPSRVRNIVALASTRRAAFAGVGAVSASAGFGGWYAAQTNTITVVSRPEDANNVPASSSRPRRTVLTPLRRVRHEGGISRGFDSVADRARCRRTSWRMRHRTPVRVCGMTSRPRLTVSDWYGLLLPLKRWTTAVR